MPKGGARPGQWNSKLNAYMIPIGRAMDDWRADSVVAVCATQVGKSAVVHCFMGKKYDDEPIVIMLFAPGDDLIKSRISPKIKQLLKSTPSLWRKTARGQAFKVKHMVVNGVDLWLASSNSSSQMSEQSAGIVILDEYGKMIADKSIEGGVWEQAEARLGAYPDGRIIAISSPTRGHVTTKWLDTGLEHFVVNEPDEDDDEQYIECVHWQKWQEGTRHQTAVPCPKCLRYFIPYSKLIRWPKGASPKQARKLGWLECPNCRHHIETRDKRFLIEKSMPVAPGQHLDKYDEARPGGVAIDQQWTEFGDYLLPDDHGGALSFHVAGCLSFSAKRNFGFLAQRLHAAYSSGDPDKIQGVLNTQHGELYAVRGERPEVKQVMACVDDYARGTVPAGVSMLSLGVDLSEDCLWWVLLGWGPRYRCWLIDFGRMMGETKKPVAAPEVWNDLTALIGEKWDGLPLTAVGLDSGDHSDQVYEYCRPRVRQRSPAVYALKGGFRLTASWVDNPVDKLRNGKPDRNGLRLITFDSVGYKKWTHERVTLNANPDTRKTIDARQQDVLWRLPQMDREDLRQYAKHIVAEELIKGKNGMPDKYNQRSTLNHWLDANSLARMAIVRERNGKQIPAPLPSGVEQRQHVPREKPAARGPKVVRASDEYRV